MSRNDDQAAWWWRPNLLRAGAGLRLQLGPLELFVMRGEHELQIATRSRPEPTPARLAETEELPEEPDLRQRYAVEGVDAGGDEIAVVCSPRPADRAVVVQPRVPLFVPAGESARIYVSSPVWVEIGYGEPPRPLCELPTKRLSDTWFGSSTIDGELAYSLQTHARTRLSELPKLSHRAATQVVIDNRGSDTLALDRLNLPVPYLSLYADSEGSLWTESVAMRRSDETKLAGLQVRDAPPREAGAVERVAGPRVTPDHNLLVRAFGELLESLGGGRTDG